MILKRIIEVVTTSQDLTSANLSYPLDISRPFKLLSVELHFSGAITKTVTITRDALAGPNWDTVLQSTALTGATDHVFRPTGECVFVKGDKLLVACGGTVALTAYAEIYYEEM